MILVVGATGLLGGGITRKLRSAHPVRMLRRDILAAQALIDLGAQSVTGDLRDRVSLDIACRGVDVVITTAIALFTDGGSFQTVDLLFTKNRLPPASTLFPYTTLFR